MQNVGGYEEFDPATTTTMIQQKWKIKKFTKSNSLLLNLTEKLRPQVFKVKYESLNCLCNITSYFYNYYDFFVGF